jgi:hypothetical protein
MTAEKRAKEQRRKERRELKEEKKAARKRAASEADVAAGWKQALPPAAEGSATLDAS